MSDAFNPVSIQIVEIADTSVSEPNLPFALDSNDRPGFDTEGDMVQYAAAHRQTGESMAYWSVHIVGIYEYGDFLGAGDNDPDGERARMGVTQGGGPEHSFVAMEIVRDVAQQHNFGTGEETHVQQVVAAHEIGHQFELSHPLSGFPDDLMTVPGSDSDEAQVPQVPFEFSDFDERDIRKIDTP